MLTISKPLSGQARTYHAREFAAKEANYWSREQQGHNEWQGKLAQEWGLQGAVGSEHFARLTEGQHPETQQQMVRHQPAKTYENQFGREVTSVEHRAGWDATFSDPKSVSLTALVGGDERVREAHRESVRVALGELERYTQARLGNVNAPELTGKFAAATFEHDTARPVDGYAAPQLHTHTVIFNVTERENGETRALDARSLFGSQQFATSVYRAELASRQQGVSIYREQEKAFSVGDRIQFTAPANELKIANRELGTIQSITDDGPMALKMDSGRSISIDPREHPHLDHGYAVTSHSSQGQTADRVLINIDTELGAKDLINNRMAYVSVSRGANDAQIFTSDCEKLPEALSRDVFHRSAHVPEIAKAAEREIEPERSVEPATRWPSTTGIGGLSTRQLRRTKHSSSPGDRRRVPSRAINTLRQGGTFTSTDGTGSSITVTVIRSQLRKASTLLCKQARCIHIPTTARS